MRYRLALSAPAFDSRFHLSPTTNNHNYINFSKLYAFERYKQANEEITNEKLWALLVLVEWKSPEVYWLPHEILAFVKFWLPFECRSRRSHTSRVCHTEIPIKLIHLIRQQKHLFRADVDVLCRDWITKSEEQIYFRTWGQMLWNFAAEIKD